ncbi:MAG: hypothetical protein AVDCRST_MAG42-3040 [uncultured Chthoniobacterales bacterium]|uniref:Uncharacterized protein n=1 Tax=uncultured Chthoniobacterales bacterium TaxID=1836801 RepID=A0A6J4J0D9_9BACT|nr:MAG: hypothetical protein AVDCRST_MAG42-3040 [uncultured Chthoniobacterales bacterium]
MLARGAASECGAFYAAAVFAGKSFHERSWRARFGAAI